MKKEFLSLTSLDSQQTNDIQSTLDMKNKTIEKDFNNTSSNSDINKNFMNKTIGTLAVGKGGGTEPPPPRRKGR